MVLNAGILQNLTFYTQRKYTLNQMKNLVVQQTRVEVPVWKLRHQFSDSICYCRNGEYLLTVNEKKTGIKAELQTSSDIPEISFPIYFQ